MQKKVKICVLKILIRKGKKWGGALNATPQITNLKIIQGYFDLVIMIIVKNKMIYISRDDQFYPLYI